MSEEEITIDDIDRALDGIKITPRDAQPALLRQMVWDGFQDEQVETVIKELNMTPSSPEVYDKELKDSHRRIADLSPLRGLIDASINNMAAAHTAIALAGSYVEGGGEIPDFMKSHIFEFHRRIIFSSIMSTLSTLNHLGFIDMKDQNGKR